MATAGIVTYNPDIILLGENINSINKQIDNLIIVDNGSTNVCSIKKLVANESKIKLICNKDNKGIATALNQIVDSVIEFKENYVLFLDQDSVCSPDLFDKLKQNISKDTALICPYIIDINKITVEEYNLLGLPELSEVKYALTSGSLIDVNVCKSIGGFDEKLFIDLVDIDFSKRININGYKQIRVNSTYLLHEVGNAEKTFLSRFHKDNSGKWTWKPLYRTNHSQMRQYYMARNEIIVARKYQKYVNKWGALVKGLTISFARMLVEKDKWQISRSIVKGTVDGFKIDVDIYDGSNQT